MRRLPIFLLLDVSESMIGDPLNKLNEGLDAILQALRADPYALETAYLSVIAFAGKARTLVPLTEVISFRPPELPVGGGTALGSGLERLMSEIDSQIALGTAERKGDWKPLVFLMTDGRPTDDPSAAVARWRSKYQRRAHLIAISIGGLADHEILCQLTDDVLILDDAVPDAFKRFIEWVSQSILAQSRSVDTMGDQKVSLAKSKPDGLILLTESDRTATTSVTVDERYAVFVGRCQKNRKPYLMKFERPRDPTPKGDWLSRPKSEGYMLATTLPIEESYFELCESAEKQHSVNTERLVGNPSCPHCGAPYGLALCACGKVHCITGGGLQKCPWCGNQGTYTADERGFDIGRARG